MPNWLRAALSIRLIRFVLVGGMNTAISYGFYAFFLFLGINYAISNLLSLIFGIFISFRTQGALVFRDKTRRHFGRFVTIWAIIYVFNIAIIGELMKLGLNAYNSGAIAILPVIMLSYITQKYFVFRQMNKN
jgi:putative flippase GtrA